MYWTRLSKTCAIKTTDAGKKIILAIEDEMLLGMTTLSYQLGPNFGKFIDYEDPPLLGESIVLFDYNQTGLIFVKVTSETAGEFTLKNIWVTKKYETSIERED